jgi:hypothetical protein
MPMTEAGKTTVIVIGGREFEKPYHEGCAACTSRMTLQIDHYLSYGWGFRRIRDYLSALYADPPSAEALRAHVSHLAAPHYQARMAFEERVSARGGNAEDPPPLDAADLARVTLEKAYQRVIDGEAEIGVRDAVAILRIKREIERDQAAAESATSAEQWQAAMIRLLWIVRKHVGKGWAAFAADVRADEEIALATGGLMAEPPERKEVSGAPAAAPA